MENGKLFFPPSCIYIKVGEINNRADNLVGCRLVAIYSAL